jgi:hypothetical protein
METGYSEFVCKICITSSLIRLTFYTHLLLIIFHRGIKFKLKVFTHRTELINFKVINDKAHPITCHEGKEGGVEVYLYSFLNLSAGWKWLVNARPGRSTPGNDLLPTVR